METSVKGYYYNAGNNQAVFVPILDIGPELDGYTFTCTRNTGKLWVCTEDLWLTEENALINRVALIMNN
jgi:hypothetical protein